MAFDKTGHITPYSYCQLQELVRKFVLALKHHGLQPRGSVTVPPVTLARKVGPELQDLQTRARRILAERNAEKAEENTWIGRMVAAESIGGLNGLIKSRAA